MLASGNHGILRFKQLPKRPSAQHINEFRLFHLINHHDILRFKEVSKDSIAHHINSKRIVSTPNQKSEIRERKTMQFCASRK